MSSASTVSCRAVDTNSQYIALSNCFFSVLWMLWGNSAIGSFCVKSDKKVRENGKLFYMN